MTHPLSFRRVLNRMKYYNYQDGLIHSHLKQEGGWDSHLENCRRVIIRALDYYKPETVTVLGSGWLLDLPLAEIAEKTGKIFLVDIVHPPQVIAQTRSLKNVVLVEQDITGGLISEVWQKTRNYSLLRKLSTLGEINIPVYNPGFDPGLVISLNILTQLEALLIDFIKKRSKLKEEEFEYFKSEIQKRHIDFLLSHPSVLITDNSEIITKNSGETHTVQTLFTEIPTGQFNEEWIWNFDLVGADNYNSKSVMKVMSVTY